MGTRYPAFLALALLAPAVAVADMHPLDCLAGYNASSGEAAAEDDEESSSSIKRLRLSCTVLYSTESTAETAADGLQSYGVVAIYPAAVFGVGSSQSSESLVGAIVYLRKWKHIQPLGRILPFGFTGTPDDSLRWSSLLGVSLDFRSPCPKARDGFWGGVRKACEYVRPGARLDADWVHLLGKPRDSYFRFGLNAGLRLEMGDHH